MFGYEYDFGDGWEHMIVLERQLEAALDGMYPYVVDGKREWADELFDPNVFDAEVHNRQIHGDRWVTPARDAAERKETGSRQITLKLGPTPRKR